MFSSAAFAADTAPAEKAIAYAKDAAAMADKAGGQWRDTGRNIKKAEEALKEGDFDKAVKHANKAKMRGELRLAKTESPKGVGNPDFLK